MRNGFADGNTSRSLSRIGLGIRPPVFAKYRSDALASSGQFCSAIWIHSGGTQVRPVTPCRAHSRGTSPGSR